MASWKQLQAMLGVLSMWGMMVVAETNAVTEVDPHAFPRKTATCTALNRATGEQKDIKIAYADINADAGRTLLMVHGWPSLWQSWKYQIDEFKDDYHLVVPDLRGFGDSTHPGDVQSSGTMADMVSDLVCALQDAKVSKAACVGHDWGTQVCYEAARMRPDIFERVIGTCIPYIPYAGPYTPMEHLTPMLPKLSYNLFFEHRTADAVKELNTDVRRSLRGTLRTVDSAPPDEFLRQTDSFLRGWDSVTEIPPIPFFTPAEEDYWVEQYTKSGFDYTLNFYTNGNRVGSWEFAQAQGNHTIPAPALSILPTLDPVADWVVAARLLKSGEHVPKLTTETVEAAHWLQLEKPAEVNAIMRKWLNEWYPPKKSRSHSASGHARTEPARDEL